MKRSCFIFRKEAMALISVSLTLTSPGQRQQLVQRSQRYLGGFFKLKCLGVGRFAGIVSMEKKQAEKYYACGDVSESK